MNTLRLNIGSGQRRFDTSKGWTNCDRIYTRGTIKVGTEDVNSRPDVACDGAALPFADGSADCVVLHHVLEHFGLGEADGLIKECHRVLQRNGFLLVFVPDLHALAAAWLSQRIDDYTYCVNLYGAYMGKEEDRHKWAITLDSFTKSCHNIGSWRCIKPFDWRVIPGASIAKDWWILGMEAVK